MHVSNNRMVITMIFTGKHTGMLVYRYMHFMLNYFVKRYCSMKKEPHARTLNFLFLFTISWKHSMVFTFNIYMHMVRPALLVITTTQSGITRNLHNRVFSWFYHGFLTCTFFAKKLLPQSCIASL